MVYHLFMGEPSMTEAAKGETLVIILGGGQGTRLYPLTKERCKPAVPLGGKYRLIDVPISNSINSGLRNIYIVSQFMSASLNQHVARAYQMDVFSSGFVSILAATQTDKQWGEDWFQGTADAVRKCLQMANLPKYSRVIILSGDQLYKMDYRDMLATHEKSGADITISVLPVDRGKVEGFGIMRIDEKGRIVDFVEKPKDDEVVNEYRITEDFAQKHGVKDANKRWLASMGIYIFEVPALLDALDDLKRIDFGRDVIPSSLTRHKTVAHLFDGYWEDIGTIGAFFEANISLGSADPPFDFHESEANKVFTEQRFLMASRFLDASVSESVISDGCFFDKGARITKSVIGIRSKVGKGAFIEDAIIMGADYYERFQGDKDLPPIGIGEGAEIRKAILDKNVSVGAGARIVNERGVDTEDGDGYCIRDGIVIIPKNTIIEPGRVI